MTPDTMEPMARIHKQYAAAIAPVLEVQRLAERAAEPMMRMQKQYEAVVAPVLEQQRLLADAVMGRIGV